MRNLKPTKIILSAYRDGTPNAVNRASFNNLICDLALVDEIEAFRCVEGRFNGKHEESVICWTKPGSILEAIDALRDIARDYSQSTVLVVHGDDAAELVEVDTECSAILGTFQRVNAPEPGEDFTKADSSFYVVR